jgi:3-deoxy-manno-octulosonate cytidylyltransferase (CMP-KDO synthetase)
VPSFYCFIPARLKSTRFPNKMLVNIKGKSLIRYVYSKCLKSKFFKDVVVATCDKKIFREIVDNKGKAVMTSNSHKGCVSRIAEAVLKIKRIKINDYICIVQGDEVLVDFNLLNSLCLFIKKKKNMILLMWYPKLRIIKNINPRV